MKLLNTLVVAAGLTFAAGATQAAVVSVFSDGSFRATSTIENTGVDEVMVTLTVDTSTGILGDIRGWFFNTLTAVDDALGADVTDFQADTSNLGNGANINPFGPFDYGVEIGGPGIGGGDDIQSTSFTLSGAGLSEDSFFVTGQALRVTSVGPDGLRGDSLKLIGAEVPLPASALLLLGGLGGLAVMRRRKQA